MSRLYNNNIFRNGFTLVEVMASSALLAIMLTTLVTSYTNTKTRLSERLIYGRALSVGQRQMELLLANPQTPDDIGIVKVDDIDSLFTWKLDLSPGPLLLNVDLRTIKINQHKGKYSAKNKQNQLTLATITVESAESDIEMEPLVIARLFPGDMIETPEIIDFSDGEDIDINKLIDDMINSGMISQDDALKMKSEMDN